MFGTVSFCCFSLFHGVAGFLFNRSQAFCYGVLGCLQLLWVFSKKSDMQAPSFEPCKAVPLRLLPYRRV